jgi:hypothetical protein
MLTTTLPHKVLKVSNEINYQSIADYTSIMKCAMLLEHAIAVIKCHETVKAVPNRRTKIKIEAHDIL